MRDEGRLYLVIFLLGWQTIVSLLVSAWCSATTVAHHHHLLLLPSAALAVVIDEGAVQGGPLKWGVLLLCQ